MAKVTWLGSAKPDDPIYKTGPVIGGKRFGSRPKVILEGSLPPDDPIYSGGPVIGGKRFGSLKKKEKGDG